MQVGEVADDCVLFRNTETYWYKVQITEPLVAHAERQTLIKSTVQTARACLVGVFEFMCNSDLIRIDK